MARMRGDDRQPDAMFSYVSAEQRVPADHPLRAIRALVDDVLRDMSREFDGLYARVGRPSIPPERLLRAQLLQIFYSIRSERLLMEQLDYNLLFRWFVGMDMDEPIWAPTVFTQESRPLLNQEIARSFFRRVVERAQALMSDEHFTVDGTLDRGVGEPEEFSAERWRHRRRRAQLPRAGAEERHARLEDRPGRAAVSQVERRRIAAGVSRPPVDREPPRPDRRCDGDRRRRLCRTRGGDADGGGAVGARARAAPHGRRRQGVRRRRFRRADARAGHHAARHAERRRDRAAARSMRRTTRHDGYAKSQHARPRIEPAFGWLKTIAWIRKVKLRGLPKVDWLFVFASAAFNLIRLPKLLPRPA